MVQKHSPLGRLNSTIELALVNINSSIDAAFRQLTSKLEDLVQAKFDELAAKIAPPHEEVNEIDDNIATEEEPEDITETLTKLIDKRFEELQVNLERKIDDKFSAILAKMEAMDTSNDILRIENRLVAASGSLKSLTNKMEKTETNLTNNVICLQQSIDRVRRLCEWYSNWSTKHEVLLEHCYVARCELLVPLKKFIANQDNPDSATELETKLNSLRIVKVDRATRFPSNYIYVNINNDLMNRFYIEELRKALAKRNNHEIRHNINALVAILSKVETFKKYDIHNYASFESTYDLKWTVS